MEYILSLPTIGFIGILLIGSFLNMTGFPLLYFEIYVAFTMNSY